MAGLNCRPLASLRSHAYMWATNVSQLEHAESKLLIVDCELLPTVRDALEMIEETHRPRLIQAEDSTHPEWRADGEELRDFMR